MPRVQLARVTQIAEIAAALAVVVSLIYVGREVQSNTAAVRSTAMQQVASADATALMTVASDSSLSRIVQIGHRDPSQLTESEAFRYELFMRQFWLSFQNIYQQSELSLIDESVWQGYVSIICGAWSRPGARDTWADHRDVLSAGFVAVVEACEAP